MKKIENRKKIDDFDYYEKKRKAGLNRWINHDKKTVKKNKPRKGRIWVNNGEKSKMFHIEDIPEGWKKGRI